MNRSLEGLLLIDKPAGPTSHDIVAAVRRATGQRRVGHTGTLDPPASGLLILALGRATRLIRFLPHEPKCYEGTIALGLCTATDDLAGEVLQRSARALPDFETVQRAAVTFVGRGMQTPPAVSARKVGGQRLYRLARSGITVVPEATPINVTCFELGPGCAPEFVSFRAEVSSGTYIRSLARDLGQRLGCGAALAELRRTSIGPWRVADALAPPAREARDWAPESTIPIDRAPLTPPPYRLDEESAPSFIHGGRIAAASGGEGWVRVVGCDGRLLGVGEILAGELCPRVVVAAPNNG